MYTHDGIRTRRVGQALRFGGIWINAWGIKSEHFEQGGYQQSRIGVLCGPSAISEFQNLKSYAPPHRDSPTHRRTATVLRTAAPRQP
ncbi:aldehyde dehydrogenase family protein [Streptomyces phaeoluteigriseus]|uniref:Aldehyde dehydrogenase family protein n=1 Tax=Streptomyces phaeoluteigriseus TaxID=114686 RepID=A0ABY4Z8Y6_9ACTN|nr:aldehyde dehydrogenase family protein [Streptomyces phaeoluteigriseus]USQ85509.1 aldehyde dehydrogenase family protein [Streptomyces phaeoluteigriseus]